MRNFINSLLVLAIFVLAVGVYLFVQLPRAGESNNMIFEETSVLIGEAAFRVEVADTPEAQGRGLAGREMLAPDRGMVFVFRAAGVHRFTMSGMRFPLDFIWIRENRVIGVTENAAAGVASIDPPGVVDTVLEINAGKAAEFGIEAGDAVVIEK